MLKSLPQNKYLSQLGNQILRNAQKNQPTHKRHRQIVINRRRQSLNQHSHSRANQSLQRTDKKPCTNKSKQKAEKSTLNHFTPVIRKRMLTKFLSKQRSETVT